MNETPPSGVTSGKLLGFIVSRRGIEVDPTKVKAILEMPPPTTEKEIRGERSEEGVVDQSRVPLPQSTG